MRGCNCGERDLDMVSRAAGVMAAALSGWHGAFLDNGGDADRASEMADGEKCEAIASRLGWARC
jgi:hypothetical protein